MINPLDSLAFSLATNKGVYAVLLGSGISRSAGIYTGWEITLDLIKRLAVVAGEDAECEEASPDNWYKNKFNKEPDYSNLLEELAKTQAERMQLLRSYFEPTEEEQEQGLKQPTNAHKAIAKLVNNGHIRVVLTTNFDRLMEQALEEVGVNPSVVSSSDGLNGALPYVHSNCTLVKLHGDYLDTRIKNTKSELAKYDKELNSFLDRVLDEFGLIICGWSAEWDAALGEAIKRCPNRRFQTFWTVRGKVPDKSKDLIQKRLASTISINGADEFFSSLEEKVTSIIEYKRPHPVSIQAAIATLKRYLSEDKYRIRLYDYINEEVDRVIDATGPDKLPIGITPTKETVTKRIKEYQEITKVLQHLFAVGCYWGGDDHISIWTKTLKKIADYRSIVGSSHELFETLRLYPALLLMYAGGMASIAAENYKTTLAILFLDGIRMRNATYQLPSFVNPISVLEAAKKHIEGKEDRKTPGSDLLFEAIIDPMKSFASHIQEETQDYRSYESEYHRVFDRFEYLMGLSVIGARATGWAPIGQNIWKHQYQSEESRVFNVIDWEVEKMQEDWPPLKAGLFGGSLENLKLAIEGLKTFYSRVSRSEGIF